MEPFTVTQHFNESSNLLRARLGLLDVLNPEQDGVPVSAVERCKKRFGLRVCIKGLLQVIRDSRGARRRVCPIPPSIQLCPFYRGKARWPHSFR